MSRPTSLVLVILDGFGLSVQDEGNAIRQPNHPRLTDLFRRYRWGVLEAAGMSVGVGWGEVGNSEVGHLGIGAGQVVYQNFPRIQLAIEDKSFFQNPEFLQAIRFAKEHNGTLHIMGLASSGGVHAHIEHIEAIMEICKQQDWKAVAIHMFTDGRDTAAQIAGQFVDQIESKCTEFGFGVIATIGGRFYAMDRNNNWDRIQKMYEAMTEGKGPRAASAKHVIEESYQKNIFDEEIVPTVITDEAGEPRAMIKNGDAIIFFNFREDRARQLTQALVSPEFGKESGTGFVRTVWPNECYMVTMMEYEKGLPVHVAFPPQLITTPFGKVISQAGLKQLRIAETEKYAHVTYFFNGGDEGVLEGEERVLIPSKKVDSYATVPAMSALEVTQRLLEELEKNIYQFILVNFANADMVGHTGDFDATRKAIEVVDECVGRVADSVLKLGGVMALTADHGNAEQKIDPQTGKSSKEHTANPVPFLVVGDELVQEKSPEELEARLLQLTPIGILADVAPTLLTILDLPIPAEMTGRNILNDLQ